MDEFNKIGEEVPTSPRSEEDNKEAKQFDAEKGEHDLKSQSLAHGWVGKVFGDKYHAPTNIIGVIALGALLILAIYAFLGTAEDDFTELLKAIFYLAIGALTSRKISE